MGYRVLTTLVLGVHFAYLAYVVVGGFLAWRWPRTIWAHLVAAAWGLAVVAVPLQCPLAGALVVASYVGFLVRRRRAVATVAPDTAGKAEELSG